MNKKTPKTKSNEKITSESKNKTQSNGNEKLPFAPIVISMSIINNLLKLGKSSSDAIALYILYYHTGRWQKTNQPYAINYYVHLKLGWSTNRIKKAKKILIDNNYITNICRKRKDGTYKGWYVRVKYIWGIAAIAELTRKINDGSYVKPKD